MIAEIKSKTATETFADMSADPAIVLIDVRTNAEWAFIGVPQVENLKTIMWQDFPSGEVNQRFLEHVKSTGVSEGDAVYLICRSGSRSYYAAQVLAGAGFTDLTNVTDGFEGDLDANGHRNKINGWRFANLPWRQS